MRKIGEAIGGLKTTLRDRARTIRGHTLGITLSAKQKDARAEQRRQESYRKLLSATRNVVNEAKRVIAEVSLRRETKIKALRQQLETMIGRVEQVMR